MGCHPFACVVCCTFPMPTSPRASLPSWTSTATAASTFASTSPVHSPIAMSSRAHPLGCGRVAADLSILTFAFVAVSRVHRHGDALEGPQASRPDRRLCALCRRRGRPLHPEPRKVGLPCACGSLPSLCTAPHDQPTLPLALTTVARESLRGLFACLTDEQIDGILSKVGDLKTPDTMTFGTPPSPPMATTMEPLTLKFRFARVRVRWCVCACVCGGACACACAVDKTQTSSRRGRRTTPNTSICC